MTMTQTLIEKLEGLIDKADDAITYDLTSDNFVVSVRDLRAIIEQAKAEKQEPVGIVMKDSNNFKYLHWFKPWCHVLNYGNKLYTTPQDQTALIRELVEALEKTKPALIVASDYYYDKPDMSLANKYNEQLTNIDALLTRAKEAML